jgi:hypothetical protein
MVILLVLLWKQGPFIAPSSNAIPNIFEHCALTASIIPHKACDRQPCFMRHIFLSDVFFSCIPGSRAAEHLVENAILGSILTILTIVLILTLALTLAPQKSFAIPLIIS